MIKFTCSCGKHYELQDRIAGREVRCNQCHKTLLVPDKSQDGPVIPLEDRQAGNPNTTSAQAAPAEKLKDTEKSEPKSDAVTEPATEPGAVVDWNTATVPDSTVQSSAEKPGTEMKSDSNSAKSKGSSSAIRLPTAGEKSQKSESESGFTKAQSTSAAETNPPKKGGVGILIFLLAIVLALGAGTYLGKFISQYTNSTFSADQRNTPQAKAIRLRKERETPSETPKPLQAATVAEKADKSEGEPRCSALKELAKTQKDAQSEWLVRQEEIRALDFYISVTDIFNSRQADAVNPLGYREDLFHPALKTVKAADWAVSEQFPPLFEVRSIGGSATLISLDGNPVGLFKSDKSAAGSRDALSSLQSALDGDKAGKNEPTQKHERSFRIDADGKDAVRVIWPAQGEARLDGNRLKEIRFSLFAPEAANAKFKPGKPQGIDKAILFASFAIRLYTETGFVEFTPVDNARLVSLCERAKHDWNAVRIPMTGNDAWARRDHGLLGPLEIHRIEIIAQPTGDGATFWTDGLELAE